MPKKDIVGTVVIIGNYQEDVKKSFAEKGMATKFISIEDLKLEDSEQVIDKIDSTIGENGGLLSVILDSNDVLQTLSDDSSSVAREGLRKYLGEAQKSGVSISATVAHPGYIDCKAYESKTDAEELKLKDMLASKVRAKTSGKSEQKDQKSRWRTISIGIGRKEIKIEAVVPMPKNQAQELENEMLKKSTDFVGKYTLGSPNDKSNKEKMIDFINENLSGDQALIAQVEHLNVAERNYAKATAINLDKYYQAVDSAVLGIVQLLGIRPTSVFELNSEGTNSGTKKNIRGADIENMSNLVSIQNANLTGHFAELLSVISDGKSSFEDVERASSAATKKFFKGRESYAEHSQRVAKFSFLLASKYNKMISENATVKQDGDVKRFFMDVSQKDGTISEQEVFPLSGETIKRLIVSAALHDVGKSGDLSRQTNEAAIQSVEKFNALIDSVPEDKRKEVISKYMKLYRNSVVDSRGNLVHSMSANPKLMDGINPPDVVKMESELIELSSDTITSQQIRDTIKSLKTASYMGMPRSTEENVADLAFLNFIDPYINPHAIASGATIQHIISETSDDRTKGNSPISEEVLKVAESHHKPDKILSTKTGEERFLDNIVHAADVYVATGLEGDVRPYNAMATRANEGVGKAFDFAIEQGRLTTEGTLDPVMIHVLEEVVRDMKQKSHEILGVNSQKPNTFMARKVKSSTVWNIAEELYKAESHQGAIVEEGALFKAVGLMAGDMGRRANAFFETLRGGVKDEPTNPPRRIDGKNNINRDEI